MYNQIYQKFKSFFGLSNSLNSEGEVTPDMFRILFSKEYPNLITKQIYEKPFNRPTRWIVLRGPIYGEKQFRGTLLIDSTKIKNWAEGHAKNTWTNQTIQQSAKEYFPEWLDTIDFDNQSVTILDKGQFGFLKDYYLDFFNNSWLKVYCSDCKNYHKNILIINSDKNKSGKTITWSTEWKCAAGHQIYLTTNSIRLFH